LGGRKVLLYPETGLVHSDAIPAWNQRQRMSFPTPREMRLFFALKLYILVLSLYYFSEIKMRKNPQATLP
jgi:hypothetical protein